MVRVVASTAGLAALVLVFHCSTWAKETVVTEKSTSEPAVVSKVSPPAPSATPTKPRALFQYKTYPQVWEAAQSSNRMILIYVSMPHCFYCDKMKNNTYCRADVCELLRDSCETLSVCRDTHPDLVRKLRVRLYPTTVLVSPNNQVLDVIEGYVDAPTLSRRLKTQLATLEQNGALR